MSHSLTDGQTFGPKDRTPGLPGSDKNISNIFSIYFQLFPKYFVAVLGHLVLIKRDCGRLKKKIPMYFWYISNIYFQHNSNYPQIFCRSTWPSYTVAAGWRKKHFQYIFHQHHNNKMHFQYNSDKLSIISNTFCLITWPSYYIATADWKPLQYIMIELFQQYIFLC